MASGLLIDLNDGNPAMQITAGMRCPSLCNLGDGSEAKKKIITNRMGNSEVIITFSNPVSISYQGTNLVPTISCVTGWSLSGNEITMSFFNSFGQKENYWPNCSVYQVNPVAQGQGLLIADSSDFTVINDTGKVGQCLWAGTVTINNEWGLPDLGVPKNQLMVFGRWSADGIVLENDGEKLICKRETSGDAENASVTARIAIFASGLAPQAGTGLNFFNAAGQCTFSTRRRPMIYKSRTWIPSWNYQNIAAGGMVLIARYGYDSRVSGSWCRAKFAGVMMSGDSIRCGRGSHKSTWTSRYSVEGNKLINAPIMIVESMY